MMVPYFLRLLCLCLASFFLVNAAVGLVVFSASRAAIRFSESMRPRHSARFLFFLRMLPLLLGVAAVVGLCVPSYLWLEPDATPERAGWACLVWALLGATNLSHSIVRAACAMFDSLRRKKSWQLASRKAQLAGDTTRALVVASQRPLLALAGVIQPRLVISSSVLRALSEDELEVALLHENAHRISRDNLKRFLLFLAPDPIPFVLLFSRLDSSWVKFREWAADDQATRGDAGRAVSLAAALLRVARLGESQRLCFLHTSLVAADHDLTARVDRLLRLEPPLPESCFVTRFPVWLAGFFVAVPLMTLMLWPATLCSVHRLLEQFLR